MSEENIRGQISAKEDEKTRIEEDAAKKEAAAEAEIENQYNPKIDAAETTLTEEEALRDEATEKAADWTQKKKEKIAASKAASKELAGLKKEKDKALNMKLKEIGSEKKAKIKEVDGEIKALKKELSAIEKEKARAAAEAAEY